MKRYSKQFLSILLVLTLTITFTSCNNQQNNNENVDSTKIETKNDTRTVKDITGYNVELPKEVNKVINLWHANNQVVLLLGGADKLIGTTELIKELPWFSHVYPKIKEIDAFGPQSGSGSFNTEDIINANPDVVITSSDDDAKILRNAGITTAVVTFRDFEGLKETVRITGEILGGESPKKAEEFCTYFDETLKYLDTKLEHLSEDEKVKVYEIRGTKPTETDGKNSICTEWIEAAGGINIAASLTEDNMSEVVLEDIISEDPEVIIVATQNAQPIIDDLKKDPAWSSVKAVKEGKVYANPVGTFLWSRYSCEEALQVLWTAKLIHPDIFEDLDMIKTVQDFYKKFYSFNITSENAQRMLDGLDPK